TVLIQLCLLTVLISFYFASFNNFPSLLALTSFECYSISHILVNRVQISNFAFWSISRYYLYFSLLYFIFLFFSHLFIFLIFPKRNENENIKIPLPGISPRKRYFSPYRLQRFFSCLSVFIGLDFFQLIENHIVEYFDVGTFHTAGAGFDGTGAFKFASRVDTHGKGNNTTSLDHAVN